MWLATDKLSVVKSSSFSFIDRHSVNQIKEKFSKILVATLNQQLPQYGNTDLGLDMVEIKVYYMDVICL